MTAGGEIFRKGQALFPQGLDGGGNPDVPEIPGNILLTAADEKGLFRQSGVFEGEILVALGQAAAESAEILNPLVMVHIQVEGGHAAHGQSAECVISRTPADREKPERRGQNTAIEIGCDFLIIPLIDAVVHRDDDGVFRFPGGDQVVHDMVNAAVMEPVCLRTAAPVGNENDGIDFLPAVARGQIHTHALGLAVHVLIGNKMHFPAFFGGNARQPGKVLPRAKLQNAALRLTGDGGQQGRVDGVGEIEGFGTEAVKLAIRADRKAHGISRPRRAFFFHGVDHEGIGVPPGGQLIGDGIAAVRVLRHFLVVHRPDGFQAGAVLMRIEIDLVIHHPGFTGVSGQVALIEQEIAHDANGFDFLGRQVGPECKRDSAHRRLQPVWRRRRQSMKVRHGIKLSCGSSLDHFPAAVPFFSKDWFDRNLPTVLL